MKPSRLIKKSRKKKGKGPVDKLTPLELLVREDIDRGFTLDEISELRDIPAAELDEIVETTQFVLDHNTRPGTKKAARVQKRGPPQPEFLSDPAFYAPYVHALIRRDIAEKRSPGSVTHVLVRLSKEPLFGKYALRKMVAKQLHNFGYTLDRDGNVTGRPASRIPPAPVFKIPEPAPAAKPVSLPRAKSTRKKKKKAASAPSNLPSPQPPALKQDYLMGRVAALRKDLPGIPPQRIVDMLKAEGISTTFAGVRRMIITAKKRGLLEKDQ